MQYNSKFTSNLSFTQKLKYPRSVFFIIVNEFCERFNYYGMRSIYIHAIFNEITNRKNG